MRSLPRPTRLLLIVPAIAFVVAAGFHLSRQIRSLERAVPSILTNELSGALKRRVEVGSAQVSPAEGRAVFRDVRVGEASPSRLPFASADRVEVTFSPREILSRKVSPAGAVKRIRVSGITVHIRRSAEGRWNFRDLFAGLRPEKPMPFRGEVAFSRARVILEDAVVRPPVVGAEFGGLSGIVDFSAYPVMTFNARSSGSSPVLDAFEAVGTRDMQAAQWSVSTRMRAAQLAWWSRYFKPPRWLRLNSGFADGILSVNQAGGKTSVAGQMRVREATADLQPVELRATRFGGTIRFAAGGMHLDLRGLVAGAPARCYGSLVAAEKPTLDLICSADRLGARASDKLLSRVTRGNLRFLSPLSFRAGVRGLWPDVSVEFDAGADEVALGTRRARSVQISGVYRGAIVGLRSVRGSMFGGQVQVYGYINTARVGTTALSGRFQRVHITHVLADSPQEIPALRGVVSGSFRVSGSLAAPRLGVTIADSNLSVNGTPVGVRAFSGVLESGRLQVVRSNLDFSGGLVTVSGTASATALDLAAELQDIKLSALPGVESKAEGTVFGLAKITGSARSPDISADIQAYDVGLRGLSLTKASGRVRFSGRELEVEDFSAFSYPMEAHVSGTVRLPRGASPDLDLHLVVQKAQVEQIGQMLRAETSATGSVDADLRLSGALPDVSAAGTVWLRNGSVEGYDVSTAHATLARSGKDISVQALRAETALGTWVGSGTVSLQGLLDLEISVSEIPLERLNARLKPYAFLKGAADADLTVGGTLKSPTVNGRMSGVDLMINGTQARSITIEAGWDGTRLVIPKAVVACTGECAVEGLEYSPSEKRLHFGVKVSSTLVEQLIQALRASEGLRLLPAAALVLRRLPYPTTGELNLDAIVDIAPTFRTVRLRGDVTDLVLGSAQAGVVQTDVALDNDRLDVRSLEMSGPEMNVTAAGSLTTAGEIEKLDIAGRNVNINLLGQFVRLPDVAGLLDIDATLTGALRSPQIEGSATLENAAVFGRKLGLLSLSRFTVTSDAASVADAQIDLSNVVFATAPSDHSAGLAGHASGTLPWDWKSLNVPRQKPMNLSLDVNSQSVASLTALLPDSLNPVLSGGRFSLNIAAGGTLSSRDLRGSASVSDGTVAVRRMPTRFTNLNGTVVFEGGQARISSFSGESSGGGSFTVGGTLDLSSVREATMDLRLAAKDLRIEEENLSGIYNERVEASVNSSNLSATGPITAPVIAGRLTLNNSTIRLRGGAKAHEQRQRELFVNPTFQLALGLGKGLWVRNPRMAIMLTGDAAVGGTFEAPHVRAGLRVARGTFALPTARLRIAPGGTVTVNYAPPQSKTVALNMEARTSVYALSPLGNRQRYDIILGIGGTPASPEIRMSSYPPGLSESTIVGALGHVGVLTGEGQEAVREDIASALTGVATPFILSPIELAVAEALGLEEFGIEYGFGQSTALYFSTRLAGKFFASYRRSFSGVFGEQYMLKVGYRFSPRLQFSLGFDEQSTAISGLEGVIRF